MNENINLCELLKGHEGETFYSPALGNCKLIKIDKTSTNPIKVQLYDKDCVWFCINGSYYTNYPNDIQLFPSKDQRDWNKWAEEQKPKSPKTWSECHSMNKIGDIRIIVLDDKTYEQYPIAKSAFALLKIHQLIEVGYGGNITNEEWQDIGIDKYTIECCPSDPNGNFYIELIDDFNHITFHTKEQAVEFLSYPENVQLLKDYYMI